MTVYVHRNTHYKGQSSAAIVADSINSAGDRLTSMAVRTRRFMLPEFNTHRRFSRNSASTRAIPLARQLEKVINGPATPAAWLLEQKGMQGGAELDDALQDQAEEIWDEAALSAVEFAKRLGELKVHKSIAGRLVEPFGYHTIIVSATEWENFFEQRCHPAAQSEIRELAECMRDAMEDSEPNGLWGEGSTYHLPFLHDDQEAVEELDERTTTMAEFRQLAVKVSSARCARVSYLNHDGRRDLDEDIALFDKLMDGGHWSPLEHVATPWVDNRLQSKVVNWGPGNIELDLSREPAVGNLLGWRSARLTMQAGGEEWL